MINRYDLDLIRNEIYGSDTGKWVVYSDHADEVIHMKDAMASVTQDYEKQLAKIKEELDRYRNGYKGSCYCCESVSKKNIELKAECKAYETGLIELATQIQKDSNAYDADAIRIMMEEYIGNLEKNNG